MLNSLPRLACAMAIGIIVLSGCSFSTPTRSQNWKTYRNPRFGFEFLYPSNWVAAPPPANGDGQAFNDPLQPGVEIRGWAGYPLSGIPPLQPSVKPNFKTEQGLSGELKVEIGTEVSSMNLVFVRENVEYNWRGQAPNKLFDSYYKFFYHVASQYKVTKPAAPSK